MKITKTVKVLLAIFIIVYILFLFEVVFLNKNEVIIEYQDNLEVTEKVEETPAETTVTFFGDMMFDRYVWHSFKNIGLEQILSDLDRSFFADSDVLFANLEGPISADPVRDVWIDDSLIFNMPPNTIDALNYFGIDGVSLANNHTLNAGNSGFATTQRLLGENNIKYAGYQNGFDQSSIVRLETEIPISIICVNFIGFNHQIELIESVEKEALDGRFVIVYPHWGVEYSSVHNQTQENLAESWIDAGADLIIGSHPHVVQDIEIYNQVPIFYSLGNFVFDQLFSKETQEGLAVKLIINKDQIETKIMPYKSEKMKPKFLEQPEEEIKTHLDTKKYFEHYLNGSITINKSYTN